MKQRDQKKPVPSYRLQWGVVLAVAAALVVGITVRRLGSKEERPVRPDSHATSPQVDWFLIVRCPEMPMEAGGVEAGQTQLKGWIDAARDAGFRPLAFTEVLNRLKRGELLPENALVLMFDPSYRNTVEQLLPLLESLQVPALWVTRSPGRIRADRRFVTGHARRQFSAEPLWDFAVGDDGDSFVLEKASAGRSLPRVFKWQPGLGVTGVNTGTSLTGLNRLHANVRWSAQEFVDRLKADVPLRRRSALSVRQIDNRMWGIVLPRGEEECFDLKAPGDRRFCAVSWEGTRGINDIELNLSIDSWFGEAWVLLRSNRELGNRVRVGLIEGRLRVLQELGGVAVDDREEAWPILPSEGLCLNLVLQGETLRITSPTISTPLEIPVMIQGTSESLVEFSLYHRVHGAAVANALQLTAAPLPNQSDPSPLEGIVAVRQVKAEIIPAPNSN